jgi:hypothetical protein
VEPKILHHPKSLLKVCMLLKVSKINGILGAYLILCHISIDFLEDKLLLLAVKGVVFGVLGHSKEVLPHLSIFNIGEI